MDNSRNTDNDNEVEKDINADSRLLQLPLEIIHLIFLRLPRIQDLAVISETCRAMYIAAKSRDALWIRYTVILQARCIPTIGHKKFGGVGAPELMGMYKEWLMRAPEKDWSKEWMTYPNRGCLLTDFFVAACARFSAKFKQDTKTTFLCIKHPDIGMVCWPHAGDTKNMWQHRIADKQVFYLIPHYYSSQVRFFMPGDPDVHCDPLAYAASRQQQRKEEQQLEKGKETNCDCSF